MNTHINTARQRDTDSERLTTHTEDEKHDMGTASSDSPLQIFLLYFCSVPPFLAQKATTCLRNSLLNEFFALSFVLWERHKQCTAASSVTTIFSAIRGSYGASSRILFCDAYQMKAVRLVLHQSTSAWNVTVRHGSGNEPGLRLNVAFS